MYPWQQELLDRTRRIETRVTRFLESQGFDTQVQKARWDGGEISIPSMACSVRELVAVVPEDFPKSRLINVYHKDEFVMTFCLEDFPPH